MENWVLRRIDGLLKYAKVANAEVVGHWTPVAPSRCRRVAWHVVVWRLPDATWLTQLRLLRPYDTVVLVSEEYHDEVSALSRADSLVAAAKAFHDLCRLEAPMRVFPPVNKTKGVQHG